VGPTRTLAFTVPGGAALVVIGCAKTAPGSYYVNVLASAAVNGTISAEVGGALLPCCRG
jgi:hypothetical protein